MLNEYPGFSCRSKVEGLSTAQVDFSGGKNSGVVK